MSQRRRTRVESRKDASIRWSQEERSGELVNVSLKGCLVQLPEEDRPPGGEPVEVAIHLEPGSPEFDIRMEGRVVRSDADGVAVDFREVSAESFPHLFRLIQYNARDPEEIEGELGSSVFGLPEGD